MAAAVLSLWPVVPFLTLFTTGFLWVGLGSLRERPRRAKVSPA